MKNRKNSLFNCLGKAQRLFFVALLSVLAITASAQSKSVSGTVVDKAGEPVIGASVVVKGTTNGTITDFDGNFSLQGVPNDGTIQVSFVGYKTQDISVAGKSSVKITLAEDTEMLDEVVVVGYGVQKKSDVTGALTRVDAEQLNARPVSNAFEALQGKAAGVDITSSQRPGTLGTIRIRGQRSLNATSEPLYVVDGVPLSAGGIESLNPRDIESIDILKDASSTAIYGSRGANGVILVTTKRGKVGQFALNYSGTLTLESIDDKSPVMSASEYITWKRWAHYNNNSEKYAPGNAPTYENDQMIFAGDTNALANINKGWAGGSWDPSKVANTDWIDFVTQTGITHEHTLSANGGTENLQASFSFGYLNNEGTQKGQEYERYTISTTVDVTPKPWLKLGASINMSYATQQYGVDRMAGTSSGPKDIYGLAKAIPRYAVPFDEDGDIIATPHTESRTYTVVDEWKKVNDERQNYRALGSFYAQVDFGKIWAPLEGLSYKFAFGPDFRYNRNGIFRDSSSASLAGSKNYASWGNNRYFSWTLDNMILYNKKFGKHNIGVTLLQTASKNSHERGSMSASDILVPEMLWNNMGIVDITQARYSAGMSTGLTESQLASYMARVNYSFNDRYLLTVSGRYDGSSVLAAGNKWDFFPSAALGWRMDQEDFMKDINWIDQLKLRVGMGTTGNASVNAYGTLGAISSYWMPFSTGNTMIFVTNEPYYSSGSNKMPNKELGWEKTTQWNYGVDYSFLNGRINGSVDVYHSITSDLLMQVTIPSLSGYPSMMQNIGKTKNFGVDLSLNVIPIQYKDFEWTSSINAAYQKEKIEELANGKNDMVDNRWFIGESINVLYDFEVDGIWKEEDAAEMAKWNENGNKFKVGMVKPVDQNGDYKLDANDDKVILGSRTPRWTLGWSNTFTWKGLELGIELYGRFGYMISTGGESQTGQFQQRQIDYWTPENKNAEWQMPIYGSGDSYAGLLGYKDASFLKLRNISLGYNIPKNICNKMGISSVKVYVQGKNLGNVYSSIDYIDLDLGTSYYNRGVTFGLNVGF
ncbi:MAG: TonB-dependent receptor [Bacteroides sp.]|nr:TonB-dependent receptor [Bacteroides sp.]